MLPDHSIIVQKVEARPKITLIWKSQVCNTHWLKSQVSKVHEKKCDISVLVLFVCFPSPLLYVSLHIRTTRPIPLYQSLNIFLLHSRYSDHWVYRSGVWANIDLY